MKCERTSGSVAGVRWIQRDAAIERGDAIFPTARGALHLRQVHPQVGFRRKARQRRTELALCFFEFPLLSEHQSQVYGPFWPLWTKVCRAPQRMRSFVEATLLAQQIAKVEPGIRVGRMPLEKPA
jgi:hypothetical protein